MAEPEELIVDAARRVVIATRRLWTRHRAPRQQPLPLSAVAGRLDLMVTAVTGRSLPLRVALPAAHPTWLAQAFQRERFPQALDAVPGTDGASIWLPAHLGLVDVDAAAALYRAMALQQARRAERGSARLAALPTSPLIRAVAQVLEAHAAEVDVARALPGLAPSLLSLRRRALALRPRLEAFSLARRPLEALLRAIVHDDETLARPLHPVADPADAVRRAEALVNGWALPPRDVERLGPSPLFLDLWTGAVLAPDDGERVAVVDDIDAGSGPAATRAARMARRPAARAPDDGDEPDDGTGAFMVQQDQPHEIAEDPRGLRRPSDGDDEASPDELGDMVSEMQSAQRVRAPGRPAEVLQSDDPLASAFVVTPRRSQAGTHRYPEWDWRAQAFNATGTTLREAPAALGAAAWVDATLLRHRALVQGVRRQFASLRAEPLRLRRQRDGDDVDLDALVEARADRRAGGTTGDTLYERRLRARRAVAVQLLIDTSGSTDGWIADRRRVIDVEKEALLVVCEALQSLGDPFAVAAFSGEGPHGVEVRTVKGFDEAHGVEVTRKIAGLEADRSTRAGAALRHAAAALRAQPAAHRLLVLLSDGKPNDVDRYDGRYGVEDMRHAVGEARAQGIVPFCLTVDRGRGDHLPHIFGASGYALLPRPSDLPAALVDWVRRLLSR